MWFLWLMFGIAIGGAVMHLVDRNNTRRHFIHFIDKLLEALEVEEEHPRSKGMTKETLEQIRKELNGNR